MENENKLFGTLFSSIDLKSEEHLDIILSTMDKDHSIYYLVEKACTHLFLQRKMTKINL